MKPTMKPTKVTINVYRNTTETEPERLIGVLEKEGSALPINTNALKDKTTPVSGVLNSIYLVERDGVPLERHGEFEVSETNAYGHTSTDRIYGYRNEAGEPTEFTNPRIAGCRFEVVGTYPDGETQTVVDMSEDAPYRLEFKALNDRTLKAQEVLAVAGLADKSLAERFMRRYTGAPYATVKSAAAYKVGANAVPLADETDLTDYNAYDVDTTIGVVTIECTMHKEYLPGVVEKVDFFAPSEAELLVVAARDVYRHTTRTVRNPIEILGAIGDFHSILKRSGR